MSRTTRLIRFARHWHARVGVLAALLFLFLALTGVALNHTSVFGLNSRPVAAPWLMHWYGLRAETPGRGFLFKHGYVIGDGQRWVMDGKLLPETSSQPMVGAVEAAGMRYVATSSTLYLYQPGGNLIDKLSGSALPGVPLSRIGKDGESVLVQTPRGIFASEDGLTWRPGAAPAVGWSKPQPLPADIGRLVAPHFAPSLPLERVLLDVHSGRIFGRHGPLVMDLAALVLMALSLSGLWIYLRSIRKRH